MVIGPMALTTTSFTLGRKVGMMMQRPTMKMTTTMSIKVTGKNLGMKLDTMRSQLMEKKNPLQPLRATWMRATTRARASRALAPWVWAALHAAQSGTTHTAAH